MSVGAPGYNMWAGESVFYNTTNNSIADFEGRGNYKICKSGPNTLINKGCNNKVRALILIQRISRLIISTLIISDIRLNLTMHHHPLSTAPNSAPLGGQLPGLFISFLLRPFHRYHCNKKQFICLKNV